MDGITRFCFTASYALALVIETARLAWPRPWLRWLGLTAGVAGVFAHTAYLLANSPSPARPADSLSLLAWVLGAFSLYGAAQQPRRAWAVFALPLVLGLLGLAYARPAGEPLPPAVSWFSGERFWGVLHGGLLLAAAVGVSVAALAGVMYLIQAGRVRRKRHPLGGTVRLLSLEQLERMNRRGVAWAFPPLSAGLALGAVLQQGGPVEDWASLKVLGTVGLWLVLTILLIMQFATRPTGRGLARWSLGVFALTVLTFAASHHGAVGGNP